MILNNSLRVDLQQKKGGERGEILRGKCHGTMQKPCATFQATSGAMGGTARY